MVEANETQELSLKQFEPPLLVKHWLNFRVRGGLNVGNSAKGHFAGQLLNEVITAEDAIAQSLPPDFKNGTEIVLPSWKSRLIRRIQEISRVNPITNHQQIEKYVASDTLHVVDYILHTMNRVGLGPLSITYPFDQTYYGQYALDLEKETKIVVVSPSRTRYRDDHLTIFESLLQDMLGDGFGWYTLKQEYGFEENINPLTLTQLEVRRRVQEIKDRQIDKIFQAFRPDSSWDVAGSEWSLCNHGRAPYAHLEIRKTDLGILQSIADILSKAGLANIKVSSSENQHPNKVSVNLEAQEAERYALGNFNEAVGNVLAYKYFFERYGMLPGLAEILAVNTVLKPKIATWLMMSRIHPS